MYAVIRAYTGNSDLADALVEREEDIRRLISGINGFKAYYLLKLAEGTSTISIFDDQEGPRSQVALPPLGWRRTCQT